MNELHFCYEMPTDLMRNLLLAERLQFNYNEVHYNRFGKATSVRTRLVMARDIEHAKAMVHYCNQGTAYDGSYAKGHDFYLAPGQMEGPSL